MHIDLQTASTMLKNNGVVAIPTETVYGLAASLNSERAVKTIFRLKKRPAENPLIVHIARIEDSAPLIAKATPHFEMLAGHFWPGPLTLVVPATDNVPEIVRSGLPTVGLRVPGHPLARALLKQTGPLVAPSANLSGRPSSTTPAHVEHDFGPDFPILDGGPSAQGLESTILVFANGKWRLGRFGSVPVEHIETLLKYPLNKFTSEKPVCPGQTFPHYSPKAKLVRSNGPCLGSYVIGFDDRHYPEAKKVFSLGSLENPEAVSRNLYSILRQIDLEQINEAMIDMNFERSGLMNTVAERLMKASL